MFFLFISSDDIQYAKDWQEQIASFLLRLKGTAENIPATQHP